MLEAQNLAARRGFAELFKDLGFRVKSGDGLVVTGPNGTGKISTLLRMLAGLDEPDAGTIIRPTGLTVGYLPQDGLEYLSV